MLEWAVSFCTASERLMHSGSCTTSLLPNSSRTSRCLSATTSTSILQMNQTLGSLGCQSKHTAYTIADTHSKAGICCSQSHKISQHLWLCAQLQAPQTSVGIKVTVLKTHHFQKCRLPSALVLALVHGDVPRFQIFSNCIFHLCWQDLQHRLDIVP